MKGVYKKVGAEGIFGNYCEIVTRLANPNNKRAVVAGGFIRDYLLGGAPKDLDIFYLDGECPIDYLNAWGIEKDYSHMIDHIDKYGQKHGGQYPPDMVDENIKIVFKGGFTIDLIRLTGRVDDIADLYARFDLSINCCCYDQGYVKSLFPMDVVLPVARDRIRPERVAKFKEKYPQLDWDYLNHVMVAGNKVEPVNKAKPEDLF